MCRSHSPFNTLYRLFKHYVCQHSSVRLRKRKKMNETVLCIKTVFTLTTRILKEHTSLRENGGKREDENKENADKFKLTLESNKINIYKSLLCV